MPFRKLFTALLCLLALSFAGCGSVYRITKVTPPATPVPDKPREKQDGVLFYAKIGVCRHETKYEEPIFDVVVTNTASKAVELSRSLGLKAYQDFQATLIGAADAKVELNKEPAYTPTGFKNPPSPDNLLLSANRTLLETATDYHHQYFYNTAWPISGSATADIKLASDGSMNEASATIQSDTLKTVLSAIPTQTLLSAVLGVDGGHPAYTVTVMQRTYVWTISDLPMPIPGGQNLTQCSSPGAALEISAATIGNYNVTRDLAVPTDIARTPTTTPAPPPKQN
jgi:hypothetical protein